jgi:hypothetical protein
MVRIFTKQLSKDNRVYTEGLREKSLTVLTGLPKPLTEEELNDAADRVYGNGYNTDDQKTEYETGLNYEQLKNFRQYLVAGTNQDWIDKVIEREKEGSIDLLPGPLVSEYWLLKQQRLIIKANDLLVPVGRYKVADLLRDERIDKSQEPWTLKDCSYSKEIGLEV